MIKTTAGLSPLARRVAQERIEHLTQLGITLSLDVAEGVDKAFVRLAFHGRRTSDRARCGFEPSGRTTRSPNRSLPNVWPKRVKPSVQYTTKARKPTAR